MKVLSLGIDPGWKNTGVAIMEGPDIVETLHFSPVEYGSVFEAVDELEKVLTPYLKDVRSFGIERYVVYGTGTADRNAEKIQHLIGAISYSMWELKLLPQMYRAIDWKPKVCKHLFKTQDFRNPSKKFDKKYSFAACEAISGIRPKTDHEADAVCIAYLASLPT